MRHLYIGLRGYTLTGNDKAVILTGNFRLARLQIFNGMIDPLWPLNIFSVFSP